MSSSKPLKKKKRRIQDRPQRTTNKESSKRNEHYATHSKCDVPSTLKFKHRIVLACISVVIALGIVEFGLRLAGFTYQLYPQNIEFGAPTPKQIKSSFQTDPELFWITKDYNDKLETARQTRPSVVFMGDSCTEWGVYTKMFEDLVKRDAPDTNLSYASLGTPGWSSFQGLQQLKRDVLSLKPKVITVYYGWNDHWKGFGIQDKEVAYVNSSLLYQVQKHLRLAQLIIKTYIGLSQNTKDATLLRVSPEDFKLNLVNIVQLARQNDIRVMLLTAPTAHEKGKEKEYFTNRHIDDLSNLIPLHQKYVNIVREVAKQEEVPLCDLAGIFDTIDFEERQNDLFHEDGIHLLPKGDAVIATALYRSFKQTGLLEYIIH